MKWRWDNLAIWIGVCLIAFVVGMVWFNTNALYEDLVGYDCRSEQYDMAKERLDEMQDLTDKMALCTDISCLDYFVERINETDVEFNMILEYDCDEGGVLIIP